MMFVMLLLPFFGILEVLFFVFVCRSKWLFHDFLTFFGFGLLFINHCLGFGSSSVFNRVLGLGKTYVLVAWQRHWLA